jgi:hypothetical protein
LPHETQIICAGAKKYYRIWFIYELGKLLAAAFGINIHGMGALPSQISFNQVYFWLLFVYCFVPLSIKLPLWQMFQVFLVCFDRMYIWNVPECSNHGQIPMFDVLIAVF